MYEPLGPFAETIFKRTYQHGHEDWEGCAARVAKFVGLKDDDQEKFFQAILHRRLMPGGRYLYAAGLPKPQNSNCFMARGEDSAEGWAKLVARGIMALSKGGGLGTNYSQIRPKGAKIKTFGGEASGPVSLAKMLNEVGRHVQAGGKRRAALWAGLAWNHPDVWEFIAAKDWDPLTRAAKHHDFNAHADLDQTNISVCLDDEFFKQVGTDEKVLNLYLSAVRSAVQTGEPGFSIDCGENQGEDLRNPCTEVTSRDDGDCCNLASVNFARIRNLDELEEITRLATRFLYYGTFVGWLPHEDFIEVRKKNRRIGLGLMGLHEWCLMRNYRYEPTEELAQWLTVWKTVSEEEAVKVAQEMNDRVPVKVRAIAPTGTIGILAETTTGIEPIYCVSYVRRFLTGGGNWKEEYVIDPTAKRLIDKGVRPEDIEDSIRLSLDVERRLRMQTFIQKFVDQGISSTINLPRFGETGNTDYRGMADRLLKYLPQLRGVTFYPDGARAGQPIVPVPYEEAYQRKHVQAISEEDACKGGTCGI